MSKLIEFKPVASGETKLKTELLEVRVLTEQEIESLRPEFEAQHAIFPNPASSFAVGAVDSSGKVIAFLFFQLQIHAEPMKIDHPHESVFGRLVEVGEKELVARCGPQVVYAFVPPGKMTRLVQFAGMQLEPWIVASKIVGGDERGNERGKEPVQ